MAKLSDFLPLIGLKPNDSGFREFNRYLKLNAYLSKTGWV